MDGRKEVQLLEMHDEVDGTTPTAATIPVHKLQPGDGNHTLEGMPFLAIIAIRAGTAHPHDRGQGNMAQGVELVRPEAASHTSALSWSTGRMLRHLLMLNT